MLKWISALFDRSKEYDTLGELVMENRRWRMFAKVGFTILTLMPILTYCSWIAPRFEDSGVTNPAVLEVINSEEYQQATQEILLCSTSITGGRLAWIRYMVYRAFTELAG